MNFPLVIDLPNGAPECHRQGLEFLAFHRDNPHVYLELRDRVRAYVARTGAKRVGIQMFVALLRHDHDFQVAKHGDFKFDNDAAAYYSRFLMHYEPDLAGVFETRTNRGEDRAGDFLQWFLAGMPNSTQQDAVIITSMTGVYGQVRS